MAETLRAAALALAETRPKNKHGQLCPVWTQRLRKVRHAVTIADCDCWILRDATADAAIVVTALARSESASPEGLDVERLVRSDRFRKAVREVFEAPGEWGPAQGYYAEWIELFIDALAARLAESTDG